MKETMMKVEKNATTLRLWACCLLRGRFLPWERPGGKKRPPTPRPTGLLPFDGAFFASGTAQREKETPTLRPTGLLPPEGTFFASGTAQRQKKPSIFSRRSAVAFLIAALSVAAMSAARAAPATQVENWPNKPLQLLVGFPAGSFTDTIARAVADQLSKSLGQPVVVQNRPGANGAIGVGDAARSAPDGYTLLVTNSSSITINPQIYKSISYKAQDFAPVTMVLDAPLILTVNPAWAKKNHIATAQDVIAFAKQNPDALTYGSAGPGNMAHLTFVSWSNRADVKTKHVPYKSASQAQLAVLSGEIDTQFDTWSSLPYIDSGKLLALAVTAPRRMAQLPKVPTMAEAGYDDFNVTFWAGLLAPAGTPPEIVNKLYEASKGMLQNAKIRAVLDSQGETVMLPPEAFRQRIDKEVADWGKIIKREALSLD